MEDNTTVNPQDETVEQEVSAEGVVNEIEPQSAIELDSATEESTEDISVDGQV
jgi:hypothetical protein